VQSMRLFVGGVLPYVAIVGFMAGVVFRLLAWKKSPQPGTMPLYPTEGTGFLPLVKEALFFPSLYRGDKPLWLFAWSFHVALALAFVGHFRAITGAVDSVFLAVGVSRGGIGTFSTVAGGVAGIVLLAAAGTLLVRRLALRRVREISTAPDFVALLLLVAVIVSGDVMRFGGVHFDLVETRTWAASLFTFSPVVPESLAFLVHALFAQLLIMYVAFSKLMHFGGFFFTFSLLKRSAP
jgi:nitrate reductase gamma subunit